MMQSVYKIVQSIESSSPHSFISTVVDVEENGSVLVWFNGSTMSVRVAFSCLITPVKGDLVFVISTSEGLQFVTAILERSESVLAEIALPDRARIYTKDSLQLSAGKHVNVTAPRVGQVSSYQYQKSDEAVWDVGKSVFHGSTADVQVGKVTIVSDWLTIIANQAVQKFRSYMRKTEQSDQVDAGMVSRKSRGVYMTHAKVMVMNSEKDTRINGERIHMG